MTWTLLRKIDAATWPVVYFFFDLVAVPFTLGRAVIHPNGFPSPSLKMQVIRALWRVSSWLPIPAQAVLAPYLWRLMHPSVGRNVVFVTASRWGTSIIAVFVAAWLGPSYIPDLLGLTSHEAAIQTLASIVGALASILGIFVAVTLLAFELSRRGYWTHATSVVFRDPTLVALVTMYLATIFGASTSMARVSIPLTDRDRALVNVSLLLFGVCLVSLFPAAHRIISGARQKREIRNLAHRIDERDIELFSQHAADRYSSAEGYVEAVENSPLFILSELATRTLRGHDRLTAKLVLAETTARLVELLDRGAGRMGADRRELIAGVLVLVRPVARTAVEMRAEGTLLSIIDFIARVQRFAVANHCPWHELVELDEFTADLLAGVSKAELADMLRRLIYIIEHIAMAHLTHNVPAESEISDLHWHTEQAGTIEHNTDKSLQWGHMSTAYVNMIAECGRAGVARNDLEPARSASAALAHFAGEVARSSDLGDLQKGWVLSRLAYLARDLTVSVARASRSDPAGPSTLLTPFKMVYLDTFASSGKHYGQTMIMQAAGTLLELAAIGALPRFELNELGAFGRGCVRRIAEPFFRGALKFVVQVFGRLRETLEANTDPLSVEAYLELHEQLTSLGQWFGSSGQSHAEIEALISSELRRFHKYNRLVEERNAGSVHWPDPGEDDPDKRS